MTGLREEARGVFSIPLYGSASSLKIANYLRRVGDWDAAQVFRGRSGRRSGDATKPSVRNAGILSSNRGFKIYREFDEKMNTVVKPLIRQIWHLELSAHDEAQIVRYKPGGHYVAHSDRGRFYKERYFTVLCYLNDDFEGGKTSFPSLNYSTVPEPGKAILFPATYIHGAEPVISGQKYVILTWVTGPLPIEWI